MLEENKNGNTYEHDFWSSHKNIIILFVILAFFSFIYLHTIKGRTLIIILISISGGILFGIFVYYLLSKGITRDSYSKIIIKKDRLLIQNPKTNNTLILRKNEIKKVVRKKVLLTELYGVVLTNPNKVFFKNYKDIKANFLMKFLSVLILKINGKLSFKQAYSKNPDDMKAAIRKCRQHNYEKYGFHDFILPTYYRKKKQLFSDLEKFVKKK